MNTYAKSTLAELIGTFTLVFIGAGTGAQAAASGAGLVGVALAHGFALMVIIYAWGSVSGAHVNPAVTLGVLVTGRMNVVQAVLYWLAQFAGAIAAAFLLKYLFGGATNLGITTGSLTFIDPLKTVVLEAVLTFFLIIAVFSSGVIGQNGNIAGLAIGMVLTMDILAGGPLTGASMNPARTLGPAIAHGDVTYAWMYFVGPFAGAVVGALLYNFVFLPERVKAPVEAAERNK